MTGLGFTVQPVIFLYMTSIMAEYTLVQHSIRTYHCFRNISQAIRGQSAISIGYYNGLLSLVCSIATLFAGGWSDSYGRKLPIALAIFSSWIAQILCIIFWTTLDATSGLYLIFAAGIVSGLSGSSSSLLANCFGYTADLVSLEHRSRAMITLEAMLYLGESFGFTLGGYFTKIFSHQIAYGFACLLGFHSILLIYSVIFLPESKLNTERLSFLGLFQTKHAFKVFRTIFRKRDEPERRTILLTVISCSFLSQIASLSLLTTLFVYLRNAPLYWSSALYGYFNAFNVLCNGITLLLVMPATFYCRTGAVKDRTLAILGFASLTGGLFYLSLVSSTVQVFLLPIFFIFKELIMPATRSMISKLVDEDEKGKSFAFLGVTSNLAFFVASQLASRIYAGTSHWFPGFLFQLLASISAIPLVILFAARKAWSKFDTQN